MGLNKFGRTDRKELSKNDRRSEATDGRQNSTLAAIMQPASQGFG